MVVESKFFTITTSPFKSSFRSQLLNSIQIDSSPYSFTGSPFQFTVGPIVGGGAHKVKAVGPGLEKAVVCEPG